VTTLLLKVLLAPALVVGSSLAGRRWGPHIAGILVALPIVAGPILLITGLEQGPSFGARAASSALLGLVSLAVFTVVFARCSAGLGWTATLAVAWIACLATDALLSVLPVPPVAGFAAVCAAGWLAGRALPRDPDPSTVEPPVWPWWDLPGRAAATAGLVLLVTALARTVGPSVTGVLAPFPVATSVVAAFVLAQRGPASVVRTLRGVPRGLFAFAVFCFGVSVLVERIGIALAFAAATVVTVSVQLLVRRLTRTG
jgi:uncharacterized membrane protein (GlpM family)